MSLLGAKLRQPYMTRTNREESRLIKLKVLASIAPGVIPHECGRDTYRLGTTTVHSRYCNGTDKFRFNINPNSLRAQYELWICGVATCWYLIPAAVLRDMHEHPNAYPDARHPEITVVSLDARTHYATYARGGLTLDLRPWFRAVL